MYHDLIAGSFSGAGFAKAKARLDKGLVRDALELGWTKVLFTCQKHQRG